jgi:glycosyltransferase involved in cell wall biosynthesis
MKIPILIPAFNPDNKLIKLVSSLVKLGASNIIIVNDGSGVEFNTIFKRLEEKSQCKILNHAINLGKGRALKTGLNFILSKYTNITGIITADADGQHLPEDIMKMIHGLKDNPNCMLIGCRQFEKDIPFRSKLGNVITKFLFRLMTGKKITDTQTGLRAIPTKYAFSCISLKGERYEYELTMLITAIQKNIDILEIPISTVYIEDNILSHFNPVYDSMLIYFVLFRFLFSSVTTSLIDFIVFSISFSFGLNIFASTLISRFVAGNYNYILNKKIVFASKSNYFYSFIKYWVLVIVLGAFSYIGIIFLTMNNIVDVIPAKILVESILFIFSFAIQRDFIFYKSQEYNEKKYRLG